MNRSPDEIEREVEETRGDLNRTVEALKDKMTPGQLIDELTETLKGSGASEMVSNLGAQVKENPMALALVGAGLAWLMTGKGVSHQETVRHPSLEAGTEGHGLMDRAAGAAGRAGEAVGHVKDSVSGAAHGLTGAAHGVKDSVTAAASGARDSAAHLGGMAADAGKSAQRGFMALLEQEPLVIGAAGLAVGVAIGAALPSTSVEDRTFGRMRDDALDKGRAAGEQAIETARHAARAAIDSAQDEADRQGLTSSEEGDSIVDKAASVVRAGVEAGRDEIEAGRTH